jgi:hypothetical protein
MAHVLSLLLPALIPSWRFFKAVEPSPRVQWAVDAGTWQDYRPRPDRISVWRIVRRLVWNPDWNETLYMVSLAERLTLAPDDQTLTEIWARLGRDIGGLDVGADPKVQFRLVFVSRNTSGLTSEVTFLSAIRPLYEICP